MKTRKVYIPALLIVLISVLLLLYYYANMPVMPQRTPGVRPEHHEGGGHGPGHEIFKLLGQISIVIGAVSFWWLGFKKKLTSPSDLIKKLGKQIYSLHTYAGWAALILVVIHSVYYLITDFDNHRTFSGLAALALMAGLSVYGWLLQRHRNRFVRATHLGLSLLWIPAIFIHGGGIVMMMTVVTVAIFIAVWWLDNKARQAVQS